MIEVYGRREDGTLWFIGYAETKPGAEWCDPTRVVRSGLVQVGRMVSSTCRMDHRHERPGEQGDRACRRH